jgi:hypothetical protein
MLGRGQEQVNADGSLPFVRDLSQRYTAEPRLQVPELLRWRIETASCAIHVEGHLNATVRWSEPLAPLSGSLN